MKYLIILMLLSFNVLAEDDIFEDGFDKGKNLTDKQAAEAVTYENQMRNQRIADENCAAFNERMKSGDAGVKIHGDLSGCDMNNVDAVGQTFGGKGGATFEMMVPMVSKMYATVFGMPGLSKITGSLKQQRAIARGQNKGKNLSKYHAKDSSGATIKMDNGDQMYDTGNPDYVADAKGDVYKVENGKPVACSDDACKQAQKDYNKKKEKKEEEDWCSKIPMATELISGATQIFKEANIEERKLDEGSDLQRNSLYALKDTHLQRSKTAQIQAAGWLATSACYVGYITKGFVTGYPVNAATYLKLGASGFLGTFYQIKVKKHKTYANEIDSLIAELPTKGECNPHTDTHCFCAEMTSMQVDPANYKKYCVPEVYQNTGVLDPMSCVDKDMNIDNNCDCKKSQSCISHQMTRTNPIGLNIGTAAVGDALKDMHALNRGDYASANLANSASAKNAHRIKNTLKKGSSKFNNSPTNTKDKDLVRSIMSAGVPASIAKKLANSKDNALSLQMSRATAASLDRKKRNGLKSAISNGSLKLSNSKFKNPSSKKKSNYNPLSMLNKRRRSNNSGQAKVEVLNFGNEANAAMNAAEISRNSSQNIFDIISNRYTTSAWRKFDVINNLNKEEKKDKK